MSEPDRETASDIQDSLNAPPTKSIHDYKYQVAYIIEDVARMPSWRAAEQLFFRMIRECEEILEDPDLPQSTRFIVKHVAIALHYEISEFGKIRKRHRGSAEPLREYAILRQTERNEVMAHGKDFGNRPAKSSKRPLGSKNRREDRRIFWKGSVNQYFAVMEASHALGYVRLPSTWFSNGLRIIRLPEDDQGGEITKMPSDDYKIAWLRNEEAIAGWWKALSDPESSAHLIERPAQDTVVIRYHFRGPNGPLGDQELRYNLRNDTNKSDKISTYREVARILRHLEELEANVEAFFAAMPHREITHPFNFLAQDGPYTEFRSRFREMVLSIADPKRLSD